MCGLYLFYPKPCFKETEYLQKYVKQIQIINSCQIFKFYEYFTKLKKLKTTSLGPKYTLGIVPFSSFPFGQVSQKT